MCFLYAQNRKIEPTHYPFCVRNVRFVHESSLRVLMSDSRLSSYRIVATNDADAAQSIVTRELTGSRISRVKDGREFRFDMNGVRFGESLVAWNKYQAEIDLDSGLVEDTVGFIVGQGAPVFEMDDEPIACTTSTAAIVSQSRMSVQRPAGSSIFVIRADYSALERCFQEVTGHSPKGRIRFDRSVDITKGSGALARQTLMHVVSQLETD